MAEPSEERLKQAEAMRELRDVRNVLGIEETESPASAVLRERRAAESALAEAEYRRGRSDEAEDRS